MPVQNQMLRSQLAAADCSLETPAPSMLTPKNGPAQKNQLGSENAGMPQRQGRNKDAERVGSTRHATQTRAWDTLTSSTPSPPAQDSARLSHRTSLSKQAVRHREGAEGDGRERG